MRHLPWVVASLGCLFPPATLAAMTIGQMNALGGSSQLLSTVDRLFHVCGLPAFISDEAGVREAKRDASWRGVAMRLSARDWRIGYGSPPLDTRKDGAWRNPAPSHGRCLAGMAWLVFSAKGQVGDVSVARKPDGTGYVTTYRVPDNLLQAHKVMGVRVGVAKRIPLATLVGRYGPPDEVQGMPGGKERHRHWVLVRIDQRPETLHAVDFEVDTDERSCGVYEISAAGTDFVNQRLELLMREWERSFVLD